MSPTFSRQGGQVQLEQSDMHHTLNMTRIAIGGFSQASIKEIQQSIKNALTTVREEKKWWVQSHGHLNVTSAMERHLAIIRENHTHSCLPSKDGIAKNPQSCWGQKDTGAPPPKWAPPAPAGDNEGAQRSEMEGLPPRYAFIPTPIPKAQIFNLDSYAKDRKQNEDFIPDLLTDEGTSTG